MSLIRRIRNFTMVAILMACGTIWASQTTWIDVRTAEEFDTQHVEGALNIPFGEIGDGVARLDLEKDSLIYLYCRSGRRAGIAKDSLEALGFTQVVNLKSLENAQTEADKPALSE
jgi:phage shock protein E